MTKKRHTLNAMIILGISAVLMLFIFLLVVHHHDIPDRVKHNRSALLSTVLSVADSTVIVLPARRHLLRQCS